MKLFSQDPVDFITDVVGWISGRASVSLQQQLGQ